MTTATTARPSVTIIRAEAKGHDMRAVFGTACRDHLAAVTAALTHPKLRSVTHDPADDLDCVECTGRTDKLAAIVAENFGSI